jgi:hypothetical protein
MIGLQAKIDYKKGEEYSYSYSSRLDAMYMLLTYGMAFDNSPFGLVTLYHPNFLSSFSSNSLKLCLVIECVDPRPHHINIVH